jgi:teichuronic acid biosynthesis glycosyltransferase TuaH
MSSTLPGSWQDLIVIMAANNWDGVRFADQQLAEALSELVPVLYVDPAVSKLSGLRSAAAAKSLGEERLRLISPGLARLTPVVQPLMERPGSARLTRTLMARAVKRGVRRLDGNVFALVESSVLVPVMGRCAEQRKVYWAQDDFVGGANLMGLSAKRLRRGEDRLLAQADMVVAANPSVRDAIEARGGKATLIPYGCDYAHFASARRVQPAPEVRLPRPIAGFMGHLGERIDVEILDAVAESGVSLLLVGPVHRRFEVERLEKVLARPNVQWVGEQDFEDLPRYLAHINVGIVPYARSSFNIGSFPLKTLEYLASGAAVVASDLPAFRWLDCEFIKIAQSPERFAKAVLDAVSVTQTQDLVTARQQFASQHTWGERASEFARALKVPGFE